MKLKTPIVSILALLFLCASALAWNCPSGQIRQQAPAGTPTSTPYYDVVEGIAFICVPVTPPPTPTAGNTNSNVNTNTNSNTNANNNSNTNNNTNTLNNNVRVSNTLSQRQQQQQGQTQTATGGNASSTSSASGGNANASAQNNGNGSNNTTTNVAAAKIPVATAVTGPIMPSAPCIKGFGGGVQFPMIGASASGGKIDQGCDDRELARSFSGPQTIASCKILVNSKKAKKAGITLADCLGVSQSVTTSQQVTTLEPPAPVVVVVPAPLVTITPVVTVVPEYKTEMTVYAPKPVAKKKHVNHLPPGCQNVVTLKCATKPSAEK